MAITIGEDAMRVIARMEYEQETDRLVGFVLTLGNEDLSISDSFIAVSFKAIQDAFLTASYANMLLCIWHSHIQHTQQIISYIFFVFLAQFGSQQLRLLQCTRSVKVLALLSLYQLQS